MPDTRTEQTDEQHARWLLAYLLDWHRREDKAGWWEYYRLRDLPEEDLFDEPRAVAGLEHVERIGFVPHATSGKPTRSVIDRYRYPVQEMEIRRNDELKLTDGKKFAEVVGTDLLARTIDIRKGPSKADVHPTAAFAHKHIAPDVLEDAIFALGERVADSGLLVGSGEPDAVARSLLLALPPRLGSGKCSPQSDEPAVHFAVRMAGDLDETVLAIQGPPGSGKTYSGGEMICELIRQGKKVRVTACSHKVIRNLLDAVGKAGRKASLAVKLGHRKSPDDEDDDEDDEGSIATFGSNEAAVDALTSGEANVVGGTAWLWASVDSVKAVDVLFVDGAAQMSLANVLAVANAARSVVLLGDPQQLQQPQKGSHPEGVNASALQHILGEHLTIPPDRGICLPVTWRLAPSICAFTSELFYESRLTSKPGLERQRLIDVGEFSSSGLWVVDVKHDGNRNSSSEEVEVVANLVAKLTASGVQWINGDGNAAQMTSEDVLVVAPYNAHVSRLAERLMGTGVRVGTVDKFQGQEAPVVIYSMATSRPEDAPRGMEFLYSLNRLNVATSRARCAAILVASPRLFEPECRTPRQMKLANALCRYRELAQNVRLLG